MVRVKALVEGVSFATKPISGWYLRPEMRRLVLLLTAFVAVAAGGSALAAQGTRSETRSGVAATPSGGLGRTAADYLGLSRKQVRERIRNGRSLAQIATEEGKSVDGLKATLLATFRGKVNAAQIEPAHAQRLLARAPALVERFVLRTPEAQGRRTHVRGAMLRVAGDYLGLSPKELVYELRSGNSLADVATARGISVRGLEAALFLAFKAKVDGAVAARRLDSARAQRLLERASAHIEGLVTRSRG